MAYLDLIIDPEESVSMDLPTILLAVGAVVVVTVILIIIRNRKK